MPSTENSPGRQSPDRFRQSVLILLPLLSVVAFYCLMITGEKNGLFKKINEIMDSETPKFLGSRENLTLDYTGLHFVDHQLAVLVTFFAPVTQLSNKALNLFTVFGFGQFGGAWTLLVMESLRRGNQGKLVSFIGIYGVFVQNISFAVSTPLYLIGHLLTSPISKLSPSVNASNVLLVSSLDLAILPFSIFLSYIVPSVLMIFPGSSGLGSAVHQMFIAFWQAFPIWTILFHWVIKRFCILFIRESSPPAQKSSPTSTAYLVAASWSYTFVLVFCTATTLPIVALSLLPPGYIPTTMPVLQNFAHSSFTSVFIPPLADIGQQINDISEGVHIFLQWDMYIGGFACLIWGMVLYRNACELQEIVDPGASTPSNNTLSTNKLSKPSTSWLKLVAKITIWSIIAGPSGASAILLWERDATVKQKTKQGV